MYTGSISDDIFDYITSDEWEVILTSSPIYF